jgi:prepilin peptidase CpaA
MLLQWGVVIGASLAAAVWDLKERKIPNSLTIPVLAGGLSWWMLHGGSAGLGESLATAGALALPYFILFVFAGGGAGDVKLMAAVGAWLGLGQGLTALVCVCFCGMVLGLLKALYERQFVAVLSSIRLILLTFYLHVVSGGKIRTPGAASGQDKSRTFPYGPAMFAGIVTAAVYHLAQQGIL